MRTRAAHFFMMGLLVAGTVLYQGAGDIYAKPPPPSTAQWRIATGICGTPVDLAVQAYTGYVFAAVQSLNTYCAGVYRSTDGGESFQKVGITNPPYGSPTVYSVSTGPGSIIFVGTSQGIFTSSDTTLMTWTQNLNGIPSYVEIYMVEWIFGTVNVYATVAADLPGGGLYRSTNSGNSWTLVKPGLDAVAVAQGHGCGTTTVVAAARSDRGGLAGGLWVSRDSGVTWDRSLSWPTNRAMDVSFQCSGNSFTNKNFGHLFIANGDTSVPAAVYRSTDFATTFVSDNQGIPGCCVSGLKSMSDSVFGGAGTFASTWSPIFNGASGFYTRSGTPRLGSAWSQFSTYGFPTGAPVESWVRATDPANQIQRFVAVVSGGILYYDTP